MATNSTLISHHKRALLVISNPSRRKLRANAFRDVGIDVVCAEHIGEARELWHPAVFDLVVIDMRLHSADAVALCAAMKTESPTQRIAWLVGSPDFLSATPMAVTKIEDDRPPAAKAREAIAAACKPLSRRGGFLEACWRMQLGRTKLRSMQATKFTDQAPRLPDTQRAGADGRSGFGEAVRQAEAEQERTP